VLSYVGFNSPVFTSGVQRAELFSSINLPRFGKISFFTGTIAHKQVQGLELERLDLERFLFGDGAPRLKDKL
jgi:hypothetical protein